jgi:hypothetical protein
MKHRIKKSCACLLAVAILMGGSNLAVSGWRNDLVSMTDSYQKVLSHFTREEEDFSLAQLDTNYSWIATYHSPELLGAVDRLLKKYYPDGFPPYTRQLRSEMSSQGQTEFFVAMYAKSRQMKKMLGKENLWEMQLMVGGKAIQPVLVKEVEINPIHYRIYPYLTKWHKGFRLVFPFEPGPADSEFELQISGPFGSHRVKFGKV